ncbi:hypothetical protein [Candidatus Desulfovibrio trichonymphae]|nr:hypothetical protein [Candidatus Desulfovibrio trichonymphae]
MLHLRRTPRNNEYGARRHYVGVQAALVNDKTTYLIYWNMSY